MSAAKTGGNGKGNKKKILVPVDLSPLSKQVLKCAAKRARDLDAEIILIHVVESPTYVHSFRERPRVNAYRADARTLARLLEEKKPQLKDLSRPLQRKHLRVKTCLTSGLPHQEVLNAAEKQKVDLIVMGTNQRTETERLLAGSLAEKVVRQSPCPVEVVPLKSEKKGARK